VIDPLERWRALGLPDKPDYAGLLTFGGMPYTQDPAELAGIDVAIVGAPTDDLVSDRPGTRFAPRAIRAASCPPGPHLEAGIDAFDVLRVIDFGDAPVVPADPAGSHAAIEALVRQVAEAGAVPIVLGGDHSIAEDDVPRRDAAVEEDDRDPGRAREPGEGQPAQEADDAADRGRERVRLGLGPQLLEGQGVASREQAREPLLGRVEVAGRMGDVPASGRARVLAACPLERALGVDERRARAGELRLDVGERALEVLPIGREALAEPGDPLGPLAHALDAPPELGDRVDPGGDLLVPLLELDGEGERRVHRPAR
jgi:hypothetical protein